MELCYVESRANGEEENEIEAESVHFRWNYYKHVISWYSYIGR